MPSGITFEEVDGNAPSFNEADVAYARENEGFEYYAPLDWQGRCTGAVACLGEETMPKKGEKRGSISSIHPSGWHSVRYGFIDGESLYNRSHLIAWKLGSENANDCNLVTGTRFMNAEGMLPFEEEVIRYIERTGNHVLYRVVPVFSEDELLCRGFKWRRFPSKTAARASRSTCSAPMCSLAYQLITLRATTNWTIGSASE
ncbi:MAG: DNA/RNA non-specific endonuclease [Slackia sp.]